jgi:hypothetical protein
MLHFSPKHSRLGRQSRSKGLPCGRNTDKEVQDHAKYGIIGWNRFILTCDSKCSNDNRHGYQKQALVFVLHYEDSPRFDI